MKPLLISTSTCLKGPGDELGYVEYTKCDVKITLTRSLDSSHLLDFNLFDILCLSITHVTLPMVYRPYINAI